MTATRHHIKIFLLLLAAALGQPTQAAAYIDPGSGSFLIQMLLAGLLGVSMVIKIYWRRIKKAISRLFKSRDKSPSAEL
jgi:hypothetical protein